PDLATSMGGTCAAVTKHLSLLGDVSGAYIRELGGAVGGRNPIRFNLTTNDDGVGVDLARSRFRVVHRTSGAVALDWTAMPNASTVGTATSYAVDMFGWVLGTSLPVIPNLMTTEGIYDVRMEVYDQLGRLTAADRCWDHHLVAPAMRTVSTVTAAGGTMSALGLTTANLAVTGANGNLAAKFMQPTSIGASLIEVRVDNPSQHAAYVTVSLGAPSMVAVSNQFRKGHVVASDAPWTASEFQRNCTNFPAVCNLMTLTTYTSGVESDTIPGSLILIRVYDVTGSWFEVAPCTLAEGCGTTGQTYEFRLPGRAASLLENSPPRKYLIAVMTGAVANFRPTNLAQPFAGPYVDAAGVSGTAGVVNYPDRCTQTDISSDGEDTVCTRRGTYTEYQAARTLTYDPLADVSVSGAAAATPTLIPAAPFTNATLPGQTPGWTTTENRI
ncbi:MAG: hypothetical protein KA297_21905, partial [Kofleriaceae bacterium]|nr:hypothetical protein [Kofleriaceae bacterium]